MLDEIADRVDVVIEKFGSGAFATTNIDDLLRNSGVERLLFGGVHNRDERIHIDDLGYGLEFTLYACRAVGALTSA